jgi:hypothetical protein
LSTFFPSQVRIHARVTRTVAPLPAIQYIGDQFVDRPLVPYAGPYAGLRAWVFDA